MGYLSSFSTQFYCKYCLLLFLIQISSFQSLIVILSNYTIIFIQMKSEIVSKSSFSRNLWNYLFFSTVFGSEIFPAQVRKSIFVLNLWIKNNDSLTIDLLTQNFSSIFKIMRFIDSITIWKLSFFQRELEILYKWWIYSFIFMSWSIILYVNRLINVCSYWIIFQLIIRLWNKYWFCFQRKSILLVLSNGEKQLSSLGGKISISKITCSHTHIIENSKRFINCWNE